MPALAARGRTSRGSWSCSSSGQRLHHSPGKGLSSPKGPALKKEGEAEEQRAPRFSSWLSYQVLFQCIFHPQSSQSLVEISAFAVVQLGQIVLPWGQIWLAHCHMDHTNQRLLSKDSGIFISYPGLHSQLPFLRDYFYSCQQKCTERYQIQFFPFLCLNQGLQRVARQTVSLCKLFQFMFVCLCLFLCTDTSVFYQVISQGSSRLLCLTCIFLKYLLRMKQFWNRTGSLWNQWSPVSRIQSSACQRRTGCVKHWSCSSPGSRGKTDNRQALS